MQDVQSERYNSPEDFFLKRYNISQKTAGILSSLMSSPDYRDCLIELLMALKGSVAESAFSMNPLGQDEYLVKYGYVKGLEVFEADLANIAKEYQERVLDQ